MEDNAISTVNKRIDSIEEKIKVHDSKIEKIEDNITQILIYHGKLEEIVKSTKEGVDTITKKIDEYNKKTQFDWVDFVTNKVIPFLLNCGLMYYLVNSIGNIAK